MDLVAVIGEREEKVAVDRDGDDYRITIGESTYTVDAVRSPNGRLSLRIDGRHFEVTVARDRDDRYEVSAGSVPTRVGIMDPLTHLAREARGAGGDHAVEQVTAYMPGRVVDVLVEEGTEVEAGQGIVVLEAMKMENEIRTEHAGTVKRLHVEAGQPVEGGDPLFEIG